MGIAVFRNAGNADETYDMKKIYGFIKYGVAGKFAK